MAIRSFFNIMNSNVFGFVHYVYSMPYLFLINLFYTTGLFVHNFIFWKYSDLSSKIMGTFFVSTAYDNATFFAVLTIIPATVLFIVKMETVFYEKYRKFIKNLDGGGSLKDIENSKHEMISVLKKELINIMQIQFVITLLLVIFGILVLLPIFSIHRQTTEIFMLLSVGYFMAYITFITITILLYFDNQEDSLKLSGIFLISNIFFTYGTLLLGKEYYGLGLPISSLISLIIGSFYLNRTLSNIDYRIFSKKRRDKYIRGGNVFSRKGKGL